MHTEDAGYALEPTTFRSMLEARVLTDLLKENLQYRSMGAATVRAKLMEVFSELVNNAAEHGASPGGQPAHVHVRFMADRRGNAFDAVVVDSGPGIRTTLARNPGLPKPESDAGAIGLAVQELVSGTGDPTRGGGLWMTVTEMRRPGRKLRLHSGQGLLTMYGAAEPALRETEHRQGVMVGLTIPV